MKNKDYISTAPITELFELLPIKMHITNELIKISEDEIKTIIAGNYGVRSDDDDPRGILIWENWLEREHTDQSNEEIKRQLLNEELGPLMRGH